MRLGFTRLAAGLLTFTVGSLSLIGCTKDNADSNAAAPTETTATTPVAAATTATTPPDTAAADSAAPDTAAEAPTTTAVGATPATLMAPNNSIFYIAVGAGSFLTLAKLLANADLIGTITRDGPFTVFAPTDDAFAAVPPETLDALLADKAKLTKVLLYHVVPGTVMTGEFKAGDLTTAEGAALKLTDNAGVFTVNDANIAAPDIKASNGVIHVIDHVLIPPDL